MLRSSALLGLALLACAKRPPVTWKAPAISGLPDAPCSDAPVELEEALTQGLRMDSWDAAELFPDLQLMASWVARVELTALYVELCQDAVVVTDPQLRFRSRRGEYLEVALITDVMVHPRLILSLQREPHRSPPPVGAWLAPDRTTLRHVGPLVLGVLEEP